MGAWAFAGRGSPPHRRQATAHGSGGIFRDKMSRFAFFSLLLLAYTGVTSWMLWNSSGEGAVKTGDAGGGGGGGSPIRLAAGGLGGSPGRPVKEEVLSDDDDGTIAAAGEPLTGGHDAAGLDGEGGAGANDHEGVAEVSGVVEGDVDAHGAVPGPAQLGGQIPGEVFGGAHDDRALVRPKSKTAPATPPPLDEDFDVTLVSQASRNRFWMLPFLCKRWAGPLSISILKEDEEDLPVELCSRMVISATAAQTPEELDPRWYPVNRLRNVAVKAVQTSHFLMTDIDIWPDVNAYQALHMRYRLETERMEDARSAIVFTAFSRRRFCEEGDCLEYANDVPETISDLKPCLETNTCGRFDANNPPGQGTAYVYYWRSMLRQPNQRTLEHILCFKSHRFEPYLVVRKTALLPTFDERFLGYGKNKIQWINHLRYSGFSFYVMPVNFVIHAPHPKSEAKLSWEKTGGGKQGKGNKLMDQTFETFMNELRAEKGPEEDTVTGLCQGDSPKKSKRFKKRDTTAKH